VLRLKHFTFNIKFTTPRPIPTSPAYPAFGSFHSFTLGFPRLIHHGQGKRFPSSVGASWFTSTGALADIETSLSDPNHAKPKATEGNASPALCDKQDQARANQGGTSTEANTEGSTAAESADAGTATTLAGHSSPHPVVPGFKEISDSLDEIEQCVRKIQDDIQAFLGTNDVSIMGTIVGFLKQGHSDVLYKVVRTRQNHEKRTAIVVDNFKQHQG
jgi:hypothetical protein